VARLLVRGKSAHTSYQCYNKGLELVFDLPGSPAYLLRDPIMALLILHGALKLTSWLYYFTYNQFNFRFFALGSERKVGLPEGV
jgi:hypothetical protein